MILLFERSGASDIELLGPSLPDDQWQQLHDSAVKILYSREQQFAADILANSSFDINDGTNYFGDEFSVLHWNASFEKYIEITEHYKSSEYKNAYAAIAHTISEIGPYIRFIAVSLDQCTTTGVVSKPELRTTSDTVERALADAEKLIASTGAVSGVDRVHTAFHGYLKAVCSEASLDLEEDANLAKIFKVLREKHPSFATTGPRGGDIDKILRCIAGVVDALNPIRNMASVAHPNQELLGEPEAMLVINSIRTLLHYLDKKLMNDRL